MILRKSFGWACLSFGLIAVTSACSGGAAAFAAAPCTVSPFSPLKSLEKIPIFDPIHHATETRSRLQWMPAATLSTRAR